MTMKKTKTLALLLGTLIGVGGCGKGGSGDGAETPPMIGLWSDNMQNYMLGLSHDTISYILEEMDGIRFSVPYQKKDDNSLSFVIPDIGQGTLTRNPETLDLSLVLNLTEGSDTITIPAYSHYDLATTAPNIARTYMYDETMTEITDTLGSNQFLPIMEADDTGQKFALRLPDGHLAWIPSDRVTFTRSKLSPEFLDSKYTQSLEDLRGHHDRTEAYSFRKMDDGKVAVYFSRVFTNGTPTQESFYIGDLDGIRLNVTHRFMNSEDWDKGDINDATALDTPFEIIMVDCFGVPYIEVGRRRFTQLQSRY